MWAPLVLVVSLGCASSLLAQGVPRPAQSWRTIVTPHFDFHTPRSLESWTRHVAMRMESYAAAVSALVGNAPRSRVTVIVDDPTGDANGYAVPLLDRPVIVLWPTPPAPSVTFGEHRGWGEILAVHEFAHIAHLTYESRNPQERFWWSLLPARVGPVARKTPAWVFEGYATLIEGRLTGSGRPHSVGRAAVLRQWALEGKLPPYGGLDNASTFLGGAMRYLVGSAFLEWLAARKGEASLEHLWRRMSARTSRTFAAAFAGVYGAPPDELYGRFVVDVTDQALRAREANSQLAPSEGELFQRLSWNTGEPAVSTNGALLAVPLRQRGAPPRLVIWRTSPEGVDSAFLRQRARILARDSLDVAPFDSFPLPRRAVATLRASAGAGYNNPRWMPNGNEILVSREVPLGDGTSRPDLYIWNWRSGAVRRVTRRAGIRAADPAPDGRRAAGVRCDAGRCDLVLANLLTGTWEVLVPGTFELAWHRPRWSQDGQLIAASAHRNGRWQVAVVHPHNGAVRFLQPPDSASRHSPVWSGNYLVVVSERGGVPNLELVDPNDGSVHIITRTLGAVSAPETSRRDGRIWYLDLHAKGLDVRRYASSTRPSPDTLTLPRSLFPVASLPPAAATRFDSAEVSTRGYGLGPRRWRYLPGIAAGADGAYALLALTNYDPVGKLGALAQGAFGQRHTWRGASLGVAWHGWSAFDVTASGFASEPGEDHAGRSRFAGGALTLGRTFDFGAHAWSWTLGGSSARLRAGDSTEVGRHVAFSELGLTARRSSGLWRSLHARMHGALGRSDDTGFSRGIASLGAVAALGSTRLRLSATAGRVGMEADSGQAASFEQFRIGGLPSPFFDDRILSQRINVPALSARGSAGGHAFAAYRVGLAQSAFPGTLYAAWFKLYDPNGAWQRLIGVEGEQFFPSIGFAGLPNVYLQYGAAYSLDPPRRRRLTLYAGARFAP
ncbi:MAG TPA: hypothetical protein VJ717_05780 [Gemmatimonadaceae bacterium]|nr:hypothetical protein [Gemmatimonadaceae bacterium]